MKISFAHYKTLCPCLLALSGCASASIESRPLEPQIHELAAENSSVLATRITAPAPSDGIGFQFVLVALPIGRVAAGESSLMFSRLAYQKLALCGYRPILETSSATSTTTTHILLLELDDLSASAYDLLVMRRLVCHVSIKAQFGTTHLDGAASKSMFRSTGFSKDLSACVKETLDIALHDVLSRLGICTSDL
jgi:hypothetical protein